MYSFHVTIHARDEDVGSGEEIHLNGRTFSELVVPHEALSTPMRVSFEQASAALAALPRLYIEPDGSFVWTSPAESSAWQVDGNLYDRGDRLLFVDLKGTCPTAEFDLLLRALGCPAGSIMFQLVHEAIFLDDAEFRRYAEIEN